MSLANRTQLLDSIEDEVKQGGYIIDWHACEVFPQSWIDLVVVLRVDSTQLYDRLKARYISSVSLPSLLVLHDAPENLIRLRLILGNRNYPEAKLQENLDSEIMEVLLQEARDSYDEEIIVELTSNTSEEMESNIERIEAWVAQWKKDHAGGAQ